MKLSRLSSLLALAILAAFSGSVHAQLIDWGSVVALSTGPSADTDVKTNGTLFDAVNSAQGGVFTATVVNGITFNGLTGSSSSGTDGYISISSDGGNFLGNEGFLGGSANYQYVIDNASDANNGSVTIGNATHQLTIGDVYQVQAFGYWSGPYAAELNGDPSVSFPNYGGGYSIGTFTATGTSETFTYGGIANNASHAGFLNDLVVEDLGPAPEPTTWAMLFGGLGVLATVHRFRRAVRL